MPLNRTAIAPPSDVLDLLEKLMTGYYMKEATVYRHRLVTFLFVCLSIQYLSVHLLVCIYQLSQKNQVCPNLLTLLFKLNCIQGIWG